MFLILSLYLLLSVVQASVRPGSAVFGALQTPPPPSGSATFQTAQFVGVYDPDSGVHWRARRRPITEGASLWLRGVADAVRFQDSRPLRDDCPSRFLYRLFILDKLNAIKNAAKRGLVTLSIDGNKLTVTRTGFLRKIATNRY